jgi:hypothetical protein
MNPARKPVPLHEIRSTGLAEDSSANCLSLCREQAKQPVHAERWQIRCSLSTIGKQD